MKLTETKPVMLAGAIAAILPAVVTLLGAFDVLDAQQLAAVSAVATAIVGVASKWAAGQVYSAPTHQAAVEVAAATMPPAVAVELARAEGVRDLADRIVAKLGPPPPDVPLGATPAMLDDWTRRHAAIPVEFP